MQKNFRYALCNNIVYIAKPTKLRREIFLAFSAITIAFLFYKSLSAFGKIIFYITANILCLLPNKSFINNQVYLV